MSSVSSTIACRRAGEQWPLKVRRACTVSKDRISRWYRRKCNSVDPFRKSGPQSEFLIIIFDRILLSLCSTSFFLFRLNKYIHEQGTRSTAASRRRRPMGGRVVFVIFFLFLFLKESADDTVDRSADRRRASSSRFLSRNVG